MTVSLITGATGFIGSVLARKLRQRGDDVVALVRKSSNTKALVELGVEPRVGNMLDAASLHDAMAGVEVVYHLASLLKMPWKEAFVSHNVNGCANVASAAAEQAAAPVLVLVSSMAAAGPALGDTPRSEHDMPQPVSLYGRVKLAGEHAATAHCEALPISIVRPPMVFGPSDRPSLPLFRAAARGLCFAPPRAAQIAMIHVEDLAEMLMATAAHGERVSNTGAIGEGVYQVAHEVQPHTQQLGMLLAEACGVPRVRAVPIPMAVLASAATVSELWGRLRDQPASLNRDKVHELTGGSWRINIDKMHSQLNYRASNLRTRLAETAAWYKQHGWIAQ